MEANLGHGSTGGGRGLDVGRRGRAGELEADGVDLLVPPEGLKGQAGSRVRRQRERELCADSRRRGQLAAWTGSVALQHSVGFKKKHLGTAANKNTDTHRASRRLTVGENNHQRLF